MASLIPVLWPVLALTGLNARLALTGLNARLALTGPNASLITLSLYHSWLCTGPCLAVYWTMPGCILDHAWYHT